MFQILSYSENVIPLKISSYSVTFVSKDFAFILSCRQNTEPKRLHSKKKESILREHQAKDT